MELIATLALQEGMVVYEDVLDPRGHIILKKNTKIDHVAIEKLKVSAIQCINIYEPEDYYDNYFDKVLHSKIFKQIETIYFENFTAYKVSVEQLISNKVPINNDDLISLVDRIKKPLRQNKTTILDILSVLDTGDKNQKYAHGLNVALICSHAASWFNLNEEETKILILCGFYYDIGKLFISDAILNKKGKLTDAEFLEMKKHTLLGYSHLYDFKLDNNIKLATLMHHERIDGTGYPQKLTGEKINKYAKIIAILDAYEAMTSYRSYREPLCPFKVIEILQKDGLGKYDTEYYLNFMKKIAEEYIEKEVTLNNGTVCKVVLINDQNLSRPMVVTQNGEYIDLSSRKDLFIERLT